MSVSSKLFVADNCVCDQDGSSEPSSESWERQKGFIWHSISITKPEYELQPHLSPQQDILSQSELYYIR